ncbi:MAG: FliM/FliN family flagellar motor switch protein [Rhodospirillales bacterium]
MANQTSNKPGEPVGGDKPGADGAPGTDMRSLLTREEIDALLGAGREAGPGALADAAPAPYQRLPLLQPVLERLAESLPRALMHVAGGPATAALDAPATVRLGEYLDNLRLPALLAVWRADAPNGAPGGAGGGAGLLALDGGLARALPELLLGGRRFAGKPQGARRGFTPIERAVAERLMAAVLAELGRAFGPVAAVEFRFERLETDARLAAVDPLHAAAALARFAVALDGRAGHIELALPYATLEPLAELLGRDHAGGPRDADWRARLAGEMAGADVKLDAVLDRVTMKLKDVLGWKIGSRVTLAKAPGAAIELGAGGVGLLQGKLGRAGDRLAVRVERWMAGRHGHDRD